MVTRVLLGCAASCHHQHSICGVRNTNTNGVTPEAQRQLRVKFYLGEKLIEGIKDLLYSCEFVSFDINNLWTRHNTVFLPWSDLSKWRFQLSSVYSRSYLSISPCSRLAGSGQSTTNALSQLVFVVCGDCNDGQWLWLTRELTLNTKYNTTNPS